MKDENQRKRVYLIIKILLIVISLFAFIMGIMLLLSAYLREFIITLVENKLIYRSLNNHEYWHNTLMIYGISFLIASIMSFCICLGKNLQKIANQLQKAYLEARKLRISQPIWLFAFLCLFLFFYVRLNINIMPVIICWLIYRLGFIKWLIKIFGKKETKTALFIACITAIIFIIIMFFFKVTIVMDFFFGTDQNRVLGDFTQVSANHYRVKVHPFYVLLWQSLYHLFCPLNNKTSLAIRIMVCVFSGLNVAIFSLFISRITKNGLLNIILCAIMTFSFPQILHGSQILEAYIFTQSSIMLMFLYFSYAFSMKEYNLTALLALSLFVTGNNIAYIFSFGIFYLILLYQISETWRTIYKNILRFFFWYIIIFNILLLIQTLLYGGITTSNIFSIIINILSEEGNYISSIHSISYVQYVKNFFNVILFQQIPFNNEMVTVFNHGWIWVLLLLIPIFGFRRITNKLLFIAITASCVFLFLFHLFYGNNTLALYSPVIMCMYLSMFAFIAQILPKKMTIILWSPLLAIMLYINIIGLYTVHRINQYVFNFSDIVNQSNEYEININMLNERIKDYKGNKLFLFNVLRKN